MYDAAEYYDLQGKRGLADAEFQYATGDDIQIARDLLSVNDRVLDLGCGYGRVALPLALQNIEVHGLDISPKLIASARADAANYGATQVYYEVGDMRKLPYEACFFDKVLCFWGSFSHLLTTADQVQCLREVYRVLKPDGYGFFVVVDPSEPMWQARLETGPGCVVSWQRVVPWLNQPLETELFIHSEATLCDVAWQSGFESFGVERRPMNSKTRLVLHLHKRQS